MLDNLISCRQFADKL